MIPCLFEVSFEVCNKVGGIHTVIRTKVPVIQKHVQRYIAIGPWFRNSTYEFLQSTPEQVPSEIQAVFDVLSKQGIYCTYGKWNISGFPETILIDYFTFAKRKNEFKTMYWDKFGVDSLYSGWDFEEPLCFATAAGMLIHEFSKKNLCIAQFHEWLAGFGVLYLKSVSSLVKTVFTTHATTLGRSLGSRGIVLSKLPPDFNPDISAKDFGILDKHSVEKASAKAANVFTTVSAITARESELLLGKKPDFLTYNGVNVSEFPDHSEIFQVYSNSRVMLIKFLEKYFDPHYTINPKEVVILYTSGRPEFINKGFSMLLDCLSNIKTDKTVVCFFFVPWKHGTLKDGVQQKLFGLSDHRIDYPELCTHYIDDESNHPFVKESKFRGLLNQKENSVKIVWYPVYLGSGDDTIFRQSYYEIISGCDLGIFPSLYEPWGYTPLESLSVGVPAITSNNCGFGEYMANFGCTLDQGLGILNRQYDDAQVKEALTKMIQDFVNLDDSVQHKIKLQALLLARKCNWREFIDNYLDAYSS